MKRPSFGFYLQMSFHNGPITKGATIVNRRECSNVSDIIALMIGIGVNSLVSGAFQYRHFFRLQLVPHITKHHQVVSLHMQYLCCLSKRLLHLGFGDSCGVF